MRVFTLSIAILLAGTVRAQPDHPWLDGVPDGYIYQIEAPRGFERGDEGPLGTWFRHLPTVSDRQKVRLFDGRDKRNQSAHYAILDIDIGRGNLQQCADAVMRLRAEYLWQSGQLERIGFDFTSGDHVPLNRWLSGAYPVVSGNKVTWRQGQVRSNDYAQFRKYLRLIFAYAGSYSLKQELLSVPLESLKIGDVFIQGGFPGHAVTVVDVVTHPAGDRMFMLAQSYMPAQDIHILKNPADPAGGPWYSLDFQGKLITPEWVFDRGDLMRFPAE